MLTEIFIYAQNVEDSEIPVNAVDTVNNSTIIHQCRFKSQNNPNNEGDLKNQQIINLMTLSL